MSTITCTSCHYEQESTNRKCEVCGIGLEDGAVEAPPVKLDSSFYGVETSAQWALTSARNLLAVNRIIFVLGMGGAIGLMIISFVPVCPPLGEGCYSEGLYNFLSLFPLGLGTLLSVLWLNGIADTIATRAALAAEVAKAQAK